MSLVEGGPSVAGDGVISRADRLAAAAPVGTRARRFLLFFVAVFCLLAAVRVITDNPDLTSSGTFGTTLRLAVPIGLAALGGLYAERCGRGQHRPRGDDDPRHVVRRLGGLAVRAVGRASPSGSPAGCAAGLLHALATVTFGVDHIISGVAIITLAGGITRYLSVEIFEGQPGGGATQSPRVEGVRDLRRPDPGGR